MHNDLILKEKWESLSVYMQLANVLSEVGRALKWQTQNIPLRSESAFLRAIELFDATIADKKNHLRKKEIYIQRIIC